MSMPSVDDRLAEVLQLFLLPDYNVASPTYHDLLLTHISDKNNGCKLQFFRKLCKLRRPGSSTSLGWCPTNLDCKFTFSLVTRSIMTVA